MDALQVLAIGIRRSRKQRRYVEPSEGGVKSTFS